MPAIQSSLWLFTLNNPTANALNIDFSNVQYIVYQLEQGESGTPHYQGFLQTKSRNDTMKRVKQYLGSDRVHLQAHKKSSFTVDDAISYCKKSKGQLAPPIELGTLIREGSNRFSKLVACRSSPERMMFEEPELYNSVVSVDKYLAYKIQPTTLTFDRHWQIELRSLLAMEPDDRTIIWVYGPNGNEGKSTFARNLLKQGWFYYRGGSEGNILSHYTDPKMGGSERHVVYDVPRSKSGLISYAFLEEAKDRILLNSKYKCFTCCEINNVHVVVMANILPDFALISSDRVIVIKCNKDTTC